MYVNDDDAERRTDLRPALIGLDAEGGVHEIHPSTQIVTVRGHAGLEHVERLDGRDVSEWVDYVAAERGWDDLRYTDESIVETVVTGLEGSA